MKIGIVTFCGVNNYGALLQAYALQMYLEARGHSVVFIRSRLSTFFEILPPWWLCWRFFFAWSLRRWVSQIRAFKDKRGRRRMWQRVTLPFVRARLHLSTAELTAEVLPSELECDAYIVGSDQMWHAAWSEPHVREVFLDFAPTGAKRLAYAVSLGGTDWIGKNREQIAGLIRKFDAISVRESTGVKIVEKLSGCNVEWMPDPTLLQSAVFYEKLVFHKQSMNYHERAFLFEYLLDYTGESLFEDHICKYFGLYRKQKIKGRISPSMTVDEWIKNERECSFVLTDSFHGTVFALIFHKSFITLLKTGVEEAQNERVVSLLAALGLTRRIVRAYNAEQLNTILQEKIVWTDIDKTISVWQQRARLFFDRIGL